ncbi:hypothetical protein [Listeria seeligeri]|uniref:hypothetical protein n=1 Tax=Listeria seeligeri TaxID=1640 RepID=UPI00194205AB|nr:hypothetical protein [Listeria seeligeri]MBM5596671.1 hypothetical protein [Listeria seeligeri]MBM5610581.1 hypothetical protein [Listeria seeligeri]
MIRILNGSRLEDDVSQMTIKESFGDIIGEVFDEAITGQLIPGISFTMCKNGNAETGNENDFYALYFRMPEELEDVDVGKVDTDIIYDGYEKK